MREKGKIGTWEQLKKACKKLKNTEVLESAILVGDTGFDVLGNQLFKNGDRYIFNPLFTAMMFGNNKGKVDYHILYESIKMFDKKVDLDKQKIKQAQEQKC